MATRQMNFGIGSKAWAIPALWRRYMPAFLSQFGVILGGVLINMLGQLMTEQFLKHLTVHALTVITKKTPTEVDDQILADAKKAWGID